MSFVQLDFHGSLVSRKSYDAPPYDFIQIIAVKNCTYNICTDTAISMIERRKMQWELIST